MQHLQMAVDLLYSLFRVSSEESCKKIVSVMSQIALLRSRLPGIEGQPPPKVQNKTLTGCPAEIWVARNKLNELQEQINMQKRQFYTGQSPS